MVLGKLQEQRASRLQTPESHSGQHKAHGSSTHCWHQQLDTGGGPSATSVTGKGKNTPPPSPHCPRLCKSTSLACAQKKHIKKSNLPHSWCPKETFLVADTHRLRRQLWHARLQPLLSSQLTPSRSEPFHPMPLFEPGSSSCHTPTQARRRTGHCPLGQSSAQLEEHSSAEPNQSAQPMDSCSLAFPPSLWQKSRAMKGKQAWSILWAGSSQGNAAQHLPFARQKPGHIHTSCGIEVVTFETGSQGQLRKGQ